MKEAVVLILDANESMAAAYENTNRFECAKQVCLRLISDLMIRSKTHEVALLVLKSPTTNHHFYTEDNQDADGNVPYPNILEIGGDGLVANGVQRPHPDLLRQLRDLTVTTSSEDLQGDFCDGIIVAADALYKKTSGKKYQRRIVLLTDAEHAVDVDSQQLLVVLDSLRAMECRLEVIGIEFHQQAEYTSALVKSEPSVVKKQSTDEKDQDTKDDEEVDDEMSDASDETEVSNKEIKRQNEMLLISLTEKTGGFVMAAKELNPILEKVLGLRTAKSTRRKIEFKIAPGLVVPARFSLLISKATAPTLRKKVVDLVPGETGDQSDAKIQLDEEGKEVTHDFQTMTTHWDPDQETKEITDIAQAYRYGSDLIPMSGTDMAGLTTMSPVQLSILGYLDEKQVPACLRMGPAYALAGADSLPACAAIAALAQVLRRDKQVGVGTLVKTKDADPILVGLLPLEDGQKPTHLCMMQLPFRGDVVNLKLDGFQSEGSSKQQAAKRLVDALMLPEDVLDHRRIANPYLQSFHQTVVQRVLDKDCPVVATRTPSKDPMGVPSTLLEEAQPVLDDFRSTFPLTQTNPSKSVSKGKPQKRSATSYHDFV